MYLHLFLYTFICYVPLLTNFLKVSYLKVVNEPIYFNEGSHFFRCPLVYLFLNRKKFNGRVSNIDLGE